MKKLTALLLALAMCGSLVACGPKDPAPTTAITDEPGKDPVAETIDPVNGWGKFDAMINEIRTTTDMAKRTELMHEAEDLLMETGALLPLYFYTDIYMQKDYLKDVYWTPFGYKYFMDAKLENGADTLRIHLASEPDKLDPALNSTVDGACLAINAFAGLMTYNAKQQQVYDLAESHVVSEDGLTYTFTLKDGLKWSNGDKLDANDFVYSWNRAADPDTGADYGYMFAPIKGYAEMVEADEAGNLVDPDATLYGVTASEDGKLLTVELESPCAYFMDLCAFPCYFPVHQASIEAADVNGDNPGAWALEPGEHFVCSGPYVLTGWAHESSMTYEKNPNYHRADDVTVAKQEYMLSSDDTAIFAAYEDGSLDFTDTIPIDEIPGLQGNPEYHLIDNLGTYYVVFNVSSDLFAGKTPSEANQMRRALALLIDRDYICENIGQSGQQPAGSFIPAGCADGNGGEFKNKDYYSVDPDDYEANVEEAIALLEQIGYVFEEDEDGYLKLSADTPIAFEYLVNSSSGNVAIGEALQADFDEIGIKMQIKEAEWSVFLNDRKDGNFDVARNGWLMDFNDPINMLEMWTTDSGNNDAQFGRK